jgi:hypothetical protein
MQVVHCFMDNFCLKCLPEFSMLFSRRHDRVNFARRLVEEDDMEIVEDQPKVCLTFRKLLTFLILRFD